MNAEQEIKRDILLSLKLEHADFPIDVGISSGDEVSSLWDELRDNEQWEDYLCEALSEFRGCYGAETGIKCDWSRHYESKSVARQLSNDKWVGWTYWHGGGKHGHPEAVDWIEDSYFVVATPKVIETFDFKKEEA